MHHALADQQLLPGIQVVDAGYVEGDHLLTRHNEQQVEWLGPLAVASSGQTRTGTGLDGAQLRIAWQDRQAICPDGKRSRTWKAGHDWRGHATIHGELGRQDGVACPSRARCPHAVTNPRQWT